MDARLAGGLVVLHMAALKQPLVPFREVLAAAVIHLAVDAACNIQAHPAVQRGNPDLLGDEVEPLHRDKTAELQLAAFSVGGSPDHPANGLSGFEVEAPIVFLNRTGQQVETDSIQPKV